MTWSKTLLWGGLIIFIALTGFVAMLPKLLTSNYWIDLGVYNSNEIGDTIGGIMGPAVGLLAALLTFFAFWAQFAANAEQRRQFIKTLKEQKRADRREQKRQLDERNELAVRYAEEQRKHEDVLEAQRVQFELTLKQQRNFSDLQDRRSRIELFESRFYTMLSIYRDNVNDMDLADERGRRVFQLMFQELRFIFWGITNIIEDDSHELSTGKMMSKSQIYQIAYLSFFFGIGKESTPKVVSLAGDELGPTVKKIHDEFRNRHIPLNEEDLTKKSYSIKTPNGKLSWGRKYKIGVGHLRRLSHYIRHVFQIVKFVDEQDPELLSLKEKYEYVSNLRAQFSTNEQLLLYYNALSVLGEPWFTIGLEKEEGSYIEKYCLIKSIPLDSANFYLSPEERLPPFNKQNRPVFEWLEIKQRMEKLENEDKI